MFSDRFEQLCAIKGVKPGRACTEMGVSRGLAAKWKYTKTNKPSAEVLEKMSVYFGMTIDEILGKELPEQKENPTSQMTGEVDEVTMELLDIINNGTDEERRDMLEMWRIMKKRREVKKG